MPNPFAPTTLVELAGRLEQRRRVSDHLASRLRDDATSALDDLDLSDLLDSDGPAGGGNDDDRLRALQLAALARASADAASDALARLAAGTYGICDRCEDPIPLARLRAIPETHLCVGCKADRCRPLAVAG